METIHEQDWDGMLLELKKNLSERNRLSTPKKYIKVKYGKGHMEKLMDKKNPEAIYDMMMEYSTWKNKYDNSHVR